MTHNPFGDPSEAENDDDFVVENLDKVDSKFRVPPGRWEAKVVEAIKELSKNSGAPMATVTFAMTGRDENGNETSEDVSGKEFRGWFSINALWKVKELLIGLDFDPAKYTDERGRTRIPLKEMPGRYCILEMEDSEYEGRTSSKISKVLPHPNGAEG